MSKIALPIRFKLFAHWLYERKILWIGVASLIIPALYIIHYRAADPIRWIGMLFQLFGIGTVALGIHKTREEFNHKHTFTVLREWIRRCPLIGNIESKAELNATMPACTSIGRAHNQPLKLGPDVKIEERLNALEENIQSLHDRINNTLSEMDDRFQRCTDDINHEKQSREESDQKIYKKLERTETGGLYISELGAFWLLIGVIMSTIPTELADLINR